MRLFSLETKKVNLTPLPKIFVPPEDFRDAFCVAGDAFGCLCNYVCTWCLFVFMLLCRLPNRPSNCLPSATEPLLRPGNAWQRRLSIIRWGVLAKYQNFPFPALFPLLARNIALCRIT